MDWLDAQVAGLYDAAMESGVRMADQIAGALEADSIQIVFDRLTSVTRAGHFDVPAPYEEAYVTYHAQRCPRTRALAGLQPLSAINLDERVPAAVWLNSGFYNELVKPTGLTALYCMGGRLSHSGDFAGIALHRERRGFTSFEVSRLKRLLPHVDRAARIRTTIAASERRATLASETLDSLSTGVVRVRGDGAVVYANYAALRILEVSDGLAWRMGRLTCDDPRAARTISAAICLASERRGEMGGIIQVPRRCRTRQYTVVVSPLPGAASDPGNVLVLIHDPVETDSAWASLLARVFGLTPAEAELAAAMLKGKSLKEIADSRRVRLTTVRTQLRAVLGKAGVHRQAELVALVAQLTPIRPEM